MRLRAAQGAETELGHHLANPQTRASGLFGWAPGTWTETGRGHRRALLQSFLGENLGSVLFQDLGLFGHPGRKPVRRKLPKSRRNAQKKQENRRSASHASNYTGRRQYEEHP